MLQVKGISQIICSLLLLISSVKKEMAKIKKKMKGIWLNSFVISFYNVYALSSLRVKCVHLDHTVDCV